MEIFVFFVHFIFIMSEGLHAGCAKGCSDHTAQLVTLHQHTDNANYRTANQIKLTSKVISKTRTTLEQSPIQVLTKLNVA